MPYNWNAELMATLWHTQQKKNRLRGAETGWVFKDTDIKTTI